MADCIERERAYRELDRWLGYLDEDMVFRLKRGISRIPSAGRFPMVQCKDCKFAHFGPNWITCQNLYGLCASHVRLDDGCSRGERRTVI